MPHTPGPGKTHSLAFRLGWLIMTCAAGVLLVVLLYYFGNSRRLVLRQAEDHLRELTLATVHRIDSVFSATEYIPNYLAGTLERTQPDAALLQAYASNAVSANPEVFGCAIAFAPEAFDPTAHYYAPYFFRAPGGVRGHWLGGAHYDYFNMEWYLAPKTSKAGVWSEPYFDQDGGNVIMTTYSTPFYRADNGRRVFTGVVTADIALDRLIEIVAAVRPYHSGHALLISGQGRLLAHPDRSLVMKSTVISLADQVDDAGLRAAGKNMLRGGQGMARINHPQLGPAARLYYAPLPVTGWSLAVVVPERELFAAVHTLARRTLLIAGLGLLALLGLVLLLARAITAPLTSLAHGVAEVAAGRLNTAMPAPRVQDEIGLLAAAFRDMTAGLADLVGQVQGAVAHLVGAADDMLTELRRQEDTINEFGASSTEIAAAVRQISATSQELAQTMQDLQQAAEAAARLADLGQRDLSRMQGGMNRMEEVAGAMAGRLADISDKTVSINNMVTVINKVAEQTNLLSLNAAVEAEKAGEYGLGFAVVAREIRRLADQTDVAAMDIRRTAGAMQASVATGVMEIDKFTREVQDGLQTVGAVAGSMDQIIDRVKTLSARFTTVNDGMHAQSAGAQQISEAMGILREGARKTTTSLKRFHEVAAQLQEAAGRLQQQTEKFQV